MGVIKSLDLKVAQHPKSSLVAHAIFNTEGKIREVEDFIRPIITERCEDNSDLRTDGDAVGCVYHEN